MHDVEPVGPEGRICMHSIGVVHSVVKQQQTGGFEDVTAIIELHPEFHQHLLGIQDYSHLLVLYWMHEQLTPKAATRPQGNREVPEVGMFACR
jgi:tRNA (adenine37-N6)-methyltransferase